MSKKRDRRQRPVPRRETEVAEPVADDPPPRRPGLFGSAMLSSGPSPMPGIGRSLSRGVLTVAGQPVLVIVPVILVALAWLTLLAIGFEGTPGRLVAVLALPPISTYFDLGTGSTTYGIGPGFLMFIGISILIRTVVVALLTGAIVEALEDGRVSKYGLLRGLRALPTVLAVHVLSFTIIIGGNLILPILGPGIGFLGFVAALVAGLFLLGFAPTAAVREGRTVLDEIRRSARAALLPNTKHLVLCSLYFFLALPVLVGFAPGGSSITANPSLVTWVFAFVVNVIHVGFLAAFAYRWIGVEAVVPEEPVRRTRGKFGAGPARGTSRVPSARARGRR